jgi:CRP-like cAMP-binding protein
MEPAIKSSRLFDGLSEGEIGGCLACCGAKAVTYEKGEMIFGPWEAPQSLHLLLDGAVAVCQDTVSGRRTVMATFREAGDLFGEVYLFLNKSSYDYYAMAVEQARVLVMPKVFFYHNCIKGCVSHARLIQNMLAILADKAYFLNKKLQLMSSGSLRQKIARLLMQHAQPDGKVALKMNREDMADFLGAARPSLSRELMKMQEEGLIGLKGKQIIICNFEAIENCI